MFGDRCAGSVTVRGVPPETAESRNAVSARNDSMQRTRMRRRHKIERRNVIRVAGLYLVDGWPLAVVAGIGTAQAGWKP